MTRKEFFIFCGVGLVSLIPILGIVSKLFSSHAETPFATTEAEAGKIAAGAGAYTDTTAAGGEAVRFPASTSGTGPTPTWSEEFSAATLDLVTVSNTTGLWGATPNQVNGTTGKKDPAGNSWDANPNQTFTSLGTALQPFVIAP